jgi:hypothetical protein
MKGKGIIFIFVFLGVLCSLADGQISSVRCWTKSERCSGDYDEYGPIHECCGELNGKSYKIITATGPFCYPCA